LTFLGFIEFEASAASTNFRASDSRGVDSGKCLTAKGQLGEIRIILDDCSQKNASGMGHRDSILKSTPFQK